MDASITNEIQALSISNDTIFLTSGGFVKLPPQISELPLSPDTGDMSYWNGSSWEVVTNGIEGAYLQFTSGAPKWVLPPPKVGDFREGGIVFWVDPNDENKGLVVDLNDISSSSPWGCYNENIAGANGIEIGTGSTNTSEILDSCSVPNTAAYLCNNSTNGGYTDWFLPTIDEFKEITNNLNLVNSMITANGGSAIPSSSAVTDYYWTSRRHPSGHTHAFYFRIYVNGGGTTNRDANFRVRAIRAF